MVLCLLGGFNLVVQDAPVELPIHAQRVLAYLSLVRPTARGHLRASLADRLWGSVPGERAHASLRTALWRLPQLDRPIVTATMA